MRRIRIRKDLMSKSDYSKKYKIDRVKIDRLISDGILAVEEISGKHYIIIPVCQV